MIYIAIRTGGIPSHPFLNNLLTGLEENNAAFLSTFFFAFFCLYLLFCTMKGNFIFGIRVPLCFSVHQIK